MPNTLGLYQQQLCGIYVDPQYKANRYSQEQVSSLIGIGNMGYIGSLPHLPTNQFKEMRKDLDNYLSDWDK